MDRAAWSIALGRRFLHGCCWRGLGNRPEVALTFDDGPDPLHTPGVLDALDRLGIAATFFLLGCRLEQAGNLIDRLAGSPHQIALHGETHCRLVWQRSSRVVDSYLRLRDRLTSRTGRDPESLSDVRPPFGLIRPDQVACLATSGFRVVLCDILPVDWASPSEIVVRRVLNRIQSGSIVALHDGEPYAGPFAARTTVAIVEALRGLNLQPTTIHGLLR